MRHLPKIAIIALLLAASASCATSGRKIDAAAVDKIQINVTTKQEVLNSLGSPEQVSHHGNGETVFEYMYARSQTNAQTFIPVVGGFMAGSKTQNQNVTITFGPDNIVRNIDSTMGGMESGEDLSAGGKAKISETDDNKRAK